MNPDTPSLKDRFGGKRALGALWIAIGAPSLTEFASAARPDLIFLDLQHGLWDRFALEAAIATVRDVPVVVRTADGTSPEIGRALDAGAAGVLVPLVEDAEQAAAIASAARFPPVGTRSGGGVRPLSGDFVRYCRDANERVTVGVMIETERGVANAAQIAQTPGIDYVFIGTGDLAISIGCFPEVDGRHVDACRAIHAACRDAGKPCGVFTFDAAAAAARAEEGYDITILANDVTVVSTGFKGAVASYAKLLG